MCGCVCVLLHFSVYMDRLPHVYNTFHNPCTLQVHARDVGRAHVAVAESTAEGRFPIASRTDMCMNIQDMVELIRDRPVATKLKRTFIL